MLAKDYIQRMAEQGLLRHVLNAMREVKKNGGERSIFCRDPDGHPDVEIIVRRVSDFTSQGQKGIEVPSGS
jgi:hypothetical protein